MNLSLILACGRNGEIGQGGGLPWPRLPEDMKWFAQMTRGRSLIMGRKTWESLPIKPLVGRLNFVLSRDTAWDPGRQPRFARVGPARSLMPALQQAGEVAEFKEVFVIGGASLFREALPLASQIYLTRVDADYPDADVRFSEVLGLEPQWTGVSGHPILATEARPGMQFWLYKRTEPDAAA